MSTKTAKERAAELERLTCQLCDAEVLVASGPAGREVWLNPEPSEVGEVVLLSDGVLELATPEQRLRREAFERHLVTCTMDSVSAGGAR